MLKPTTNPITGFQNSFEPQTEYRLIDVRIDIPDEKTAIFTASVAGPKDGKAWVRAWLSNEEKGTLAQGVAENVSIGDQVTVQVNLTRDSVPELACIRVESEPLATKHTVHLELN